MAQRQTFTKSTRMLKKRRKDLEELLEFANADLSTKKGALAGFQAFKILDNINMKHLKDDSDYAAEAAEIMTPLQNHLCGRIEMILKNKDMLVSMPLWEVTGTLQIVVEPLKESFYIRAGTEFNEESSLESARNNIDLLFMEIIRDLGLRPDRFRQCPICQGFFYQQTENEKIYCSTRCGNTERVRKFRGKRREAKDADK